jgi:hypothetical protein
MTTINLDDEIKAAEMQIAFWQGKLDILQSLKRAGAVVQLPETPVADIAPANG